MEAKTIVCVVIKKDNKFLMVQEGKEHCFKEWNFPAGHLEYGENIIDGAVREAYEETGYKVKIVGLLGIHNYLSRSKNHCIRFNFIGEIIDGEAKFDGKEIIDVKWISLDDIKNMDDKKLRTAKAIRHIIKNLESGKTYNLDLITDVVK